VRIWVLGGYDRGCWRAPRAWHSLNARQAVHDADGLHADADDLAHEPDDVFLVVGPIRVGADAAAAVFGDLILIDDPIQALRLPRRYWNVSGGIPASVSDGFTYTAVLSLLKFILFSTRYDNGTSSVSTQFSGNGSSCS
jgi:hypothetical protein